ncbi:MAG: cold-shock protein [Gammaproteobacteria bacterium]|nr:cold-shock protein [Gammaproteobacteria bacterium]
MATGTVKWFNNAKGYGFVLSESGGGDLFVHYSSIQMAGYKTLRAGQRVDFDVQEGPKGPHAINIRLAEGETGPEDEAAAGDDAAESGP